MSARAQAAGVALRPHAKTHKSVEIARRQIAAGAVGVCCAKLGEAEALAAGGVAVILLTSPVVGAPAVERLVGPGGASRRCMAVVDHPDAVAALAATKAPLRLVVDIDPGIHRTGVASPADAVALARAIDGDADADIRRRAVLLRHAAAYRRASPIARRRSPTAPPTSPRSSPPCAKPACPPDGQRRRHRLARHRHGPGRLHRAAGRLLRLHGQAVRRLRPAPRARRRSRPR